MNSDPWDLPGYAEEEARIERDINKLIELTGFKYETIKGFFKQGLTTKEIIEALRDYKTETNVPLIMGNIPSDIQDIISSRMIEKKLEIDAPGTGYKALDYKIKGFVPGHLYTFTGETNVGKTSMACNFAYRMGIKENRKILYFALEPDNTVVDYLASIASEKKFDDLVDSDYKKIPESIKVFTKDNIKNITDVTDAVMDLPRFDLIIIDHIGYFTRDTVNTNQNQSNVIKELAGLAKRKKCAIMIIAHLRKGTKDMPTMDDISGSAAFKQDSTEVLIAIRDKVGEVGGDKFGLEYKNSGFILVSKTKSGKPGAIQIYFQDGGGMIYEENELKEFGQQHFNEAKRIFTGGN
jgi:replicative DNA helicase